MEATLLDLSPFYLEEAKRNDDRFRRFYNKFDQRAKHTEIEPLKLIQAKAENMPLADESYDILNCVYLFHELPADVRKECAKEFFRVLKPGGIVCWNDSIQANDRDGIDE